MKNSNIKVVCRVRPEYDTDKNGQSILKKNENSTSLYMKEKANLGEGKIRSNSVSDNRMSSNGIGKEEVFHFDEVLYQDDITQKYVFETIGKPALDGIFQGYNGTILCYGQTSSGKTFTMEGKLDDLNLKGLIPRSMEYIFEYINNSTSNLEFSIKCSYMEIYNERLNDLLDGIFFI